jgi:hypothetical protein
MRCAEGAEGAAGDTGHEAYSRLLSVVGDSGG